MAVNSMYQTYTPGKRNSSLWFININKILNIKLPAKGCELPIYHPRCIGEKNLVTNYTEKRHLTDEWKHTLELLNQKEDI